MIKKKEAKLEMTTIKISKDAIRNRNVKKPAKKPVDRAVKPLDNSKRQGSVKRETKPNKASYPFDNVAFAIVNFNKSSKRAVLYVNKEFENTKTLEEVKSNVNSLVGADTVIDMRDADDLLEFQYVYMVKFASGLEFSLPKNNVVVFRIPKKNK